MKAVTFIAMTSLVFVTAACGKVGKSARASVKPDRVSHKIEDCPKINSTYERGNASKKVETKQVEKAIWLSDSGVTWVIDGNYHSNNGQPLRYKGACKSGVVTIYLFNTAHQALGSIKYSWSAVTELEIEHKFRDAKVGPSGKETWKVKTTP